MSKIGLIATAIVFLLPPLAAQTITVTSPNGGETLAPGSAGQIAWTAVGVSQNVKIILLREDGSRYAAITRERAFGASPYPWTVGQTVDGMAPAGNYKVRVSTIDGTVTDISDRAFAIGGGSSPTSAPRLRIIKPHGGEKLKQGGSYSISWESRDVRGTLRLALFKGKVKVMDITGNLPASPSVYKWEVGRLANGDMAPIGDNYFIGIKAAGGASNLSDRPFAIARRSEGGARGSADVRITVQGNTFSPGGRLTFTYDCGCGFPTGPEEFDNSIFLKRTSWVRNRWLGVGKITRDATSGSQTIDLTPGLEQADDWVIAIWWGNNDCWGESAPFSIRRPAGSPILDFPHDGETLYRGWDFEIDWDRTLPNWDRVKIYLLKGDTVVDAMINGATRGIWWRVGMQNVWEQGQPAPEGGSLANYADGSDFRIRLTDCDTGETVESGFFSIATPRIAILVPSGPGHFKRGQRIMVSWRGYHLPPRDIRAGISVFMCPAGDCSQKYPDSCYPNRAGGRPVSSFAILRDSSASEGNFSWLVPVDDDEYLWPKADCDPLQIRIKVNCLDGSNIKDETDLLTIEHD